MTTTRLHLLTRGQHPTARQASETLQYRGRLWFVEIDKRRRWNGGDGQATAIVNPVPLPQLSATIEARARSFGLIVDIAPGDVLVVEGDSLLVENDIEFVVIGSPVIPVLRLVENEGRHDGAANRKSPRAADSD